MDFFRVFWPSLGIGQIKEVLQPIWTRACKDSESSLAQPTLKKFVHRPPRNGRARAFRYAVLHCVVEVAASTAADRSFSDRTDGRTGGRTGGPRKVKAKVSSVLTAACPTAPPPLLNRAPEPRASNPSLGVTSKKQRVSSEISILRTQ